MCILTEKHANWGFKPMVTPIEIILGRLLAVGPDLPKFHHSLQHFGCVWLFYEGFMLYFANFGTWVIFVLFGKLDLV